MIKVESRLHEVALATTKGIFFANLRKGNHGLREQDVQQLEGALLPYGRSSRDDQSHREKQSMMV